MSDPIISPDGKLKWSGTEWIPLDDEKVIDTNVSNKSDFKREQKVQEKISNTKEAIGQDGLMDDIPPMINLPEFEDEKLEIAAEQNENMISIENSTLRNESLQTPNNLNSTNSFFQSPRISFEEEKRIFVTITISLFLFMTIANIYNGVAPYWLTPDILLALILTIITSFFIWALYFGVKLLFFGYYKATHIRIPLEELDDFYNDKIENFSIFGVGLVEPKTIRQSVGLGVGKGGVGVGTSKSFYSGEEQVVVDNGTLIISKQKIQFIGSSKQISWNWNKIIDVKSFWKSFDCIILISVSSRKNISGFTIRADKYEIDIFLSKILDRIDNQA